MAKTIVLVEDEVVIRENYTKALKAHGFNVMSYSSVASAQVAFENRLPDLVLLDIHLEDEPEGGFLLCRQLRVQSAQLPIMFLTAFNSDFDIISGLRLGADDYVTKDMSLPHLMARINALLRRVISNQNVFEKQEVVTCDDLTMDVERVRATWKSHKLDLTLTEFWMLHALAKHPGHVKTREQLMEVAKVVVDDSTITSHIKRIRKKFIQFDADFDSIDTVYGMGYRWKSME